MAAATMPSTSRIRSAGAGLVSLRSWPLRRWFVAAAIALLAAFVMGVRTGIVHTTFSTRMTPVLWWNYPVWAVSAGLVGLMAATYVRDGATPSARPPDRSRRTAGAALLSTFAIGCPICNKLVVAVVGVGGALSIWAPIQPVLGVLIVVLLATGLRVRLDGARACTRPVHPSASIEHRRRLTYSRPWQS